MEYHSRPYLDTECKRWQENMYQLDPEPPAEKEINNFVLKYKETGDFLYIRFFLHHYEKTLNNRTHAVCVQYSQRHRFQDIKQTIVTVMLAKLEQYDPTVGTTLVQYTNIYVTAEIHDLIRQVGGPFSMSEYWYDKLRQVNAIFYDRFDLPIEKRIEEIVFKVEGLDEKDVRSLVDAGENFRFYKSLNMRYLLSAEGEEQSNEYDVADDCPSPGDYVPNRLFYDEMEKSVDRLQEKPRRILFECIKICHSCWRVIGKKDRLSHEEIGNLFHLRSDNAVDVQRRKAIAFLVQDLTERGQLSAIKITMTEKKIKNKQIVWAKFTYQPFFDGEEGLIEIDFTKPAEKGATITKLADLDTTKTHEYGMRAIRYLYRKQQNYELYNEMFCVWF